MVCLEVRSLTIKIIRQLQEIDAREAVEIMFQSILATKPPPVPGTIWTFAAAKVRFRVWRNKSMVVATLEFLAVNGS
jgi:hypothetical protein